MRYRCRLLIGLVILLPTVGFGSQRPSLHTVGFLTLSRSAEAIGKGGVYASPDVDDPLATFWNPAAAALYSASHRVALSGSGPSRAGDQSTIALLGVGIGARHKSERIRPIRLALGLTRSTFRTNPALALGVRGKGVRAAAGIAYELVSTDHWGDSDYWHHRWLDAGALAYFPLAEMIAASRGLRLLDRELTWRVTPGTGLALINGLSETQWYDYHDAIGDLSGWDFTPPIARLHLSLETGLDWQIRPQTRIKLLSVSGAIAEEDVLLREVPAHPVERQSLFADMNPLNDLIFAQANDRVARCRGVEVGLLDILALRWGSYEPQTNRNADEFGGTTQGFSLKLHGITDLFGWLPRANRQSDRAVYASQLDFVWSRAIYWTRERYYTGGAYAFRSHKEQFDQFTLAFRF